MSETKKESEVGLLIKQFEYYQKVFWSCPKSLRNSKVLESLEVQEVYSAWAMWKRGLVSILCTFYLWMVAFIEYFQI